MYINKWTNNCFICLAGMKNIGKTKFSVQVNIKLSIAINSNSLSLNYNK